MDRVVRTMDRFGRVVIPVEFRKVMSLKRREPLEVLVGDDCVVLRKPGPSCVLCGSTEGLEPVKGRMVCHSCIEEAARRFNS